MTKDDLRYASHNPNQLTNRSPFHSSLNKNFFALSNFQPLISNEPSTNKSGFIFHTTVNFTIIFKYFQLQLRFLGGYSIGNNGLEKIAEKDTSSKNDQPPTEKNKKIKFGLIAGVVLLVIGIIIASIGLVGIITAKKVDEIKDDLDITTNTYKSYDDGDEIIITGKVVTIVETKYIVVDGENKPKKDLIEQFGGLYIYILEKNLEIFANEKIGEIGDVLYISCKVQNIKNNGREEEILKANPAYNVKLISGVGLGILIAGMAIFIAVYRKRVAEIKAASKPTQIAQFYETLETGDEETALYQIMHSKESTEQPQQTPEGVFGTPSIAFPNQPQEQISTQTAYRPIPTVLPARPTPTLAQPVTSAQPASQPTPTTIPSTQAVPTLVQPVALPQTTTPPAPTVYSQPTQAATAFAQPVAATTQTTRTTAQPAQVTPTVGQPVTYPQTMPGLAKPVTTPQTATQYPQQVHIPLPKIQPPPPVPRPQTTPEIQPPITPQAQTTESTISISKVNEKPQVYSPTPGITPKSIGNLELEKKYYRIRKLYQKLDSGDDELFLYKALGSSVEEKTPKDDQEKTT